MGLFIPDINHIVSAPWRALRSNVGNFPRTDDLFKQLIENNDELRRKAPATIKNSTK
jgi:hypothetical protein